MSFGSNVTSPSCNILEDNTCWTMLRNTLYMYIYINGTSEWVDDEVLAKTTGCMCKLPIKKMYFTCNSNF